MHCDWRGVASPDTQATLPWVAQRVHRSVGITPPPSPFHTSVARLLRQQAAWHPCSDPGQTTGIALRWSCVACRYAAHAADWCSDGRLYAYAAHNSVVLLNPVTRAVACCLSGHTNRCGRTPKKDMLSQNCLFDAIQAALIPESDCTVHRGNAHEVRQHTHAGHSQVDTSFVGLQTNAPLSTTKRERLPGVPRPCAG